MNSPEIKKPLTLAEQLSKPLTADEIEFRAGTVNNGGYILLLAYKSARIDMDRLNKVIGVGYWKRTHREFRGSIYCIVQIWNSEIKQWVDIEDTGYCKASSFDPSIQTKGEASDSFKRACFNLGIGIELYSYPVMSIKLDSHEWQKGENGGKAKTTWNFKLKEWLCYTEFDDNNKIKTLALKDETGKRRFTWKVEAK